MKKYFVHNGTKQFGPFTFDELVAKPLSSSLKVWYEGLSDWKSIEEIEELKSYIVPNPPQFESSKFNPPPFSKFKEWAEKDYMSEVTGKIKNPGNRSMLKSGMMVFAIIGLLACIVWLWPTKEKEERNHPEKFLYLLQEYPATSYDGTYFIAKGTLLNAAEMAHYSKVAFEVLEWNSESSVVVYNTCTFDLNVNPGERRPVNLRVEGQFNPYKKYMLRVVKAERE